jgi:hypothetical protein
MEMFEEERRKNGEIPIPGKKLDKMGKCGILKITENSSCERIFLFYILKGA